MPKKQKKEALPHRSGHQSPKEPPAYRVYLLRCNDGTLYCGITNDLQKRVALHNSGKGAKYTRSRLPVRVVYQEKVGTRGDALKREREIKKMTKSQKESLAKQTTILD